VTANVKKDNKGGAELVEIILKNLLVKWEFVIRVESKPGLQNS
jgi:hypothetical protein